MPNEHTIRASSFIEAARQLDGEDRDAALAAAGDEAAQATLAINNEVAILLPSGRCLVVVSVGKR